MLRDDPKSRSLRTFELTREQMRLFWKSVAQAMDGTTPITPDRQERILFAASNWWLSPSWAFSQGHSDDPIGCSQWDTDKAIRYAKVHGLYLSEMKAEEIFRKALLTGSGCPEFLKKHFEICEARMAARPGKGDDIDE